MFDTIFIRWVETGQLTQDDIVPIFLEWNQTFGDGLGRPEHVLALLQFFHTDYGRIMNNALKLLGIKKGYEWSEVYDQQGKLLTRFWNKKPY